MSKSNFFKILSIIFVGVLYSSIIHAGTIIIRGPAGEVYQINDKLKIKNGVRITQIRWPDNKVDTIHVSGCGGNGVRRLTRFSANGKERYETLPWSPSGINLIDRVSIAVCETR